MSAKIFEPIYTEDVIADKIKELAKSISSDYGRIEPLIVGILRGSTVFMADLARELTINAYFDFIVVTRYGDKDKGGQLRVVKDLNYPIEGKDVLIVEDIIDEGITLMQLKKELLKRKPSTLKICTLFDKPVRRIADIVPDYIGFEIPDKFVIGYGMDYKQKYRNIPYLAAMEES